MFAADNLTEWIKITIVFGNYFIYGLVDIEFWSEIKIKVVWSPDIGYVSEKPYLKTWVFVQM